MSTTSPPPVEIGPYKVVEHIYDEELGIYRLAIARPRFVPAYTLEKPSEDPDDPDGHELVGVPEEPIDLVDYLDFIFDANDPRWHDSEGERRPDQAVTEEQKQIAKDAVAEIEERRAAVVANSRVLPGVGDEL